jgi:hypothetical protein
MFKLKSSSYPIFGGGVRGRYSKMSKGLFVAHAFENIAKKY